MKEERQFELKKKIASELVLQQAQAPIEANKDQQQTEGRLRQNKGFTEEDIISIQQKAIYSYETKRKAEKKIRKEEEAKVKQEALIHQKIARAVQQDPNDLIWGQCFN